MAYPRQVFNINVFNADGAAQCAGGRLLTGLQMRSAAQGSSGVMGAEGDAPLALRRSIDKGMTPNEAGRRIGDLEIYEPDVLAKEMQPVLQYAASLFPRK